MIPPGRTGTQRRSGRGVGLVAPLEALGGIVVVCSRGGDDLEAARRAELVHAERELHRVEERARIPAQSGDSGCSADVRSHCVWTFEGNAG